MEYACKHFHYAKSVPATQFAYNVYNGDDEWCGCIVYSGGANNHMAGEYGKVYGEVLELVRVALNGKQECTSQAVAMSLKHLKKDNPLVSMIVSYADSRQGHLGIIYQATNWIYLGERKTATREYYLNGRWVHRRSIDAMPNHLELVKSLPSREGSVKHKYLFCFSKKDRKQYMKQALPYPKESGK